MPFDLEDYDFRTIVDGMAIRYTHYFDKPFAYGTIDINGPTPYDIVVEVIINIFCTISTFDNEFSMNK